MPPLFDQDHSSDIAGGQNFSRRRSIAIATDSSWSLKKAQRETQLAIKLNNSVRRLIRKYHWATMSRQPLCSAHLISPTETAGAISRELDIVRRICIDKIIRLNLQQRRIGAEKSPIANSGAQARKIRCVVDSLVTPKRHVEVAAAIKAAESVKAGAIQKVEKLRGFAALCFPVAHQLVKACAMAIEKLLVVAHLDSHLQPTLRLHIKIYQVWIEIVQNCLPGLQSKRRRQSAAKRFDVPPRRMRFPKCFQVGHQPALSPRPFQRWRRPRFERLLRSRWSENCRGATLEICFDWTFSFHRILMVNSRIENISPSFCGQRESLIFVKLGWWSK